MARGGVDFGGRRLRRLHDPVTEPTFGKRELKGAPLMRAPFPAPPPRRLRSRIVIVAGVGLLALGVAGAAADWRDQRCRPRAPGDPEPSRDGCDLHGGSYGGHGFGFFGGGAGVVVGHASFGGFGATGAGHGGGS